MKINSRFTNQKETDLLNQYIAEEALKLEKFFNGRLEINCYCEKRENLHQTKLTILGPNFDYHSKHVSISAMDSINRSFSKISKQLERKKQKSRHKIKKENLSNPKHMAILKLIQQEEKVAWELEEVA